MTARKKSRRDSSQPLHPMLSAAQFIHLTYGEGRGASIDLETGEPLKSPGGRGYAVGGARDKNGERIPSKKMHNPRVGAFAKHLERVREAAPDDPKTVAGSWRPKEDTLDVVLDASDIHRRKSAALYHARVRNEEEIYDLQRGRSIPNPYFDKKQPQR